MITATVVMATFASSDIATVSRPFHVVLNASSTVRHVNGVDYSVCFHTMFLKHNMCSFVPLTSMAKKTRRDLTVRRASFAHSTRESMYT